MCSFRKGREPFNCQWSELWRSFLQPWRLACQLPWQWETEDQMLPPSCLALLLARCRVGLLVKNCWGAHLVRPGSSKQPPPYPQISACLLWGIAKTVSQVVCPQKQGDSHCWVPTVCQALPWMLYRQNKWHLPMNSHLKRLQEIWSHYKRIASSLSSGSCVKVPGFYTVKVNHRKISVDTQRTWKFQFTCLGMVIFFLSLRHPMLGTKPS